MIFFFKNVYFVIFSINLSNFVNLMITDEECYDYYSKFGIHINNLKIEVCEEVNVLTLPKEDAPRFALHIEHKNNSELFVTAVSRHRGGLLINGRTPMVIMWNEMRNNKTFMKSNTTYVDEFAPDLTNFSLYHNPEKNVALVLFYYGSYSVIEGVVGDYMLRFIERSQKYIWMKVKYPYERIPFNWKSLGVPEVNKLDPSHFNLNSHLDVVNISTIVILDNLSIEGKSPYEVIKSVIIYFNAVNMLYANFTSPKIQLIIKTLVVPITVYGSTYDQYKPLDLLQNRDSFWSEPGVIFDMAITPTCNNKNSTNCIAHSDTINFRLYCDENNPMKKSPAIFQIRHMDFHGGYVKTAQMVALTLNASLLNFTDKCTGIMDAYRDPPDLSLHWSLCTVNKLSNYFKSVDAHCFRDIVIVD